MYTELSTKFESVSDIIRVRIVLTTTGHCRTVTGLIIYISIAKGMYVVTVKMSGKFAANYQIYNRQSSPVSLPPSPRHEVRSNILILTRVPSVSENE